MQMVSFFPPQTHTIQGTTKDGGILPRTFDVLFNSIRGKQYVQSDLKPVSFSSLEQLNEEQIQREEAFKGYLFNYGIKENLDVSAFLKLDASICTVASETSVCSSVYSECAMKKRSDHYLEAQNLASALESRIADQTAVDLTSEDDVNYSIWVSYSEIYNEYIYDLLSPIDALGNKHRTALRLAEDKNGNPYVKGLREVNVKCTNEAYRVLSFARHNQRFSATRLNDNSSRSHCVFTIKVVRVSNDQTATLSRLSFVDLAGSERQGKTKNTGGQLKESNNINKSIMTLGKCINSIRYNESHMNHPIFVPYRESKLTRLFQPFFVGRMKGCLIVNASQSSEVFDETYHVMKFSAMAKQVTIKPRSNRDQPAFVIATNSPKQQHLLDASYIQLEDEYTREELAILVQKLNEDLKRQNIEKHRFETELRSKIYQEFKQISSDVEKECREQFEEDLANTEEFYEKRIELLTKTAQKTMQLRGLDGNEGNVVPLTLLEEEREKVMQRERTIGSLQLKIRELSHYQGVLTPDRGRSEHALSSELEEAKETLDAQNRHIEELQIALNTASEYSQEKEQQILRLKEVVASDEEENKAQENILSDLRQTLSRISGELEIARVKLNQRDEKIKALEAASLGSFDSISVEAEERIALQKSIDDLKHSKRDSDEERQKVQFEKDEMSIKLERYESLVKEHRSVLNDNETFIEQLNKENRELKRQIEASQGELQTSNTASSKEVEDLKKEINFLKKSKILYEKENENLQLQLTPKVATVNSPRGAKPSTPSTMTPKQKKVLKSHCHQMASRTPSEQRSQTPLSSHPNIQMITQLEKSLADTKQLVDSKAMELAAKVKVLSNKDTMIIDLQSQLKSLESEIVELKSEKLEQQKELELLRLKMSSEAKITANEIMKLESRLAETSLDLERKASEIEKLQIDSDKANAIHAMAQEEAKKFLEERNKECVGLETKLSSIIEERSYLQSELHKVQVDFKQWQGRKSFARINDNNGLSDELTDALQRIGELELLLKEKSEQLNRFITEEKANNKIITGLKDETLSLKSEVKILLSEKDNMELKLSALKKMTSLDEIGETSKCEAMTAEIERLNDELASSTKEKNKIQSTLDHLIDNRKDISGWIEDVGDSDEKTTNTRTPLHDDKDRQIKELTRAKTQALAAMRESHDLLAAKTEQLQNQIRLTENAEASYSNLLKIMEESQPMVTPSKTRRRQPARARTLDKEDINDKARDDIEFITPQTRTLRSATKSNPRKDGSVSVASEKKSTRKARATRSSSKALQECETNQEEVPKKRSRKLYKAQTILSPVDSPCSSAKDNNLSKENMFKEQASFVLENRKTSSRIR